MSYSQKEQPWLLDGAIAKFRERLNYHEPWRSAALQLLEEQFIDVVKGIDRNNQRLRAYANGQVPFIIDLLPHHLEAASAPTSARHHYEQLMQDFKQKYMEFTTLREALIEMPKSRVVPYCVEVQGGLTIEKWQIDEPWINEDTGKLAGPALFLKHVQAWAIVDVGGQGPDHEQQVIKWMKRSELDWIANVGPQKLLFMAVNDEQDLRLYYSSDGRRARLPIQPKEWKTPTDNEHAYDGAMAGEQDLDQIPKLNAAKDGFSKVKKEEPAVLDEAESLDSTPYVKSEDIDVV